MGESTDHRPLEGIKIVEFSTMMAAGPCGRMLANWEAEVIKVESASGGMSRNSPKTFFVPRTMDENPLFDNLNAGRRGVVLNLETLGGMSTMHRLLVGADIFLTNIGPKALGRLGLDYISLREAYPKLIMANANGFGKKGPKKGNPGFGTVALWTSSGLDADMMAGGPDSYPVYSSTGPGDVVTAMGLCYVITAALYKRSQTGPRDHVSSSLYGAALWCFHIMAVATEKQYDYTYPKTCENSTLTGASFRTKDSERVVTIILQIEKQWPILCNALGVPELGTDPRYNTAVKQRDPEMRKYLMRHSKETYKIKTVDEWCRILTNADIINSRLTHYKDMETNEQVWANEYIHKVTYPSGKKSIFVRLAMRDEKMGIPRRKRGPMLDEHTEEVLKEYGCMDEQVEEMKKKETAVQLDVSGCLHLDRSSVLPDGMTGFSDGG